MQGVVHADLMKYNISENTQTSGSTYIPGHAQVSRSTYVLGVHTDLREHIHAGCTKTLGSTCMLGSTQTYRLVYTARAMRNTIVKLADRKQL